MVKGGVSQRKYKQIGSVVIEGRSLELWGHPLYGSICVIRDPETGVEVKWIQVDVLDPKKQKEVEVADAETR